MPRVTWGREISPEIRESEWIDDLNDLVESKRKKNKPTYQEIADFTGISRQALMYKLRKGTFTLKEFCAMADYLKFPDHQILELIRGLK